MTSKNCFLLTRYFLMHGKKINIDYNPFDGREIMKSPIKMIIMTQHIYIFGNEERKKRADKDKTFWFKVAELMNPIEITKRCTYIK